MAKKTKANLKYLPLGGLGEIGMNLALIGYEDDWIILDAGVQFCEVGMVGADQVLPDLDLLAEYRGRVKAIVLTHGHEDHLGAVGHVVEACPAPVYAPPFACELLRLKASHYGDVTPVDLRPVSPGQNLTVGPFTLEFVRVTHSIPDCHAVVLRTPVGTVVHTGDFKIDPEPFDGRHFDRDRFRALGDEGVRLLLSDSTNAEVPGRTRPEKVVAQGLETWLEQTEGRIIVSLFASNVHRVRALAEMAKRHGRRLCLIGRSLSIYNEAAERSLRLPPLEDLVDPRHLHRMHDHEVLIVCTGSQAEARAVLYRASQQDHPDLRIKEGDLLLMSSRMIPGNERSIHRMLNHLSRLGARVVHEKMSPIHGSGHAYQEELREMLRLVRPKTFVPVHGEFAFLRVHAEIALEEGIDDVHVIENGQLLEVTAEDVKVSERIQLTPHYVDEPLVGDASELALDERKRIGWTGVVAARVRVEPGRRQWKAVVDLHAVGVPLVQQGVLDEAAHYAAEQVAELSVEAPRKQIEETLGASLKAFFKRRMSRKPSVLCFVEVSGE